jgi:DNA segregation ATPase FtsK/SpoIIIE, S-DNA-T family
MHFSELLEIEMAMDFDVLPVIEPGSFDPCVVEPKPKPADEVKRRSSRRAEARHRSDVVRNFRFEQRNVHRWIDRHSFTRTTTLGRKSHADFLKFASLDVTIARAGPRAFPALMRRTFPWPSGLPSMNHWQKITVAAVLAGFACFVEASVLGRHPGDPPLPATAPANLVPLNWCGWLGAALSGYLVELFGSSAAVAGLPIIAIVFGLFSNRLKSRSIVAVGTLLVLAAAPALSQAFAWSFAPTPIGSGGLLGATMLRAAEVSLGEMGSLLVLWPMFAIGLLMIFHQPMTAIKRLASRIARPVTWLVGKLRAEDDLYRLSPATARSAPSIPLEAEVDELDDEEVEEEEESSEETVVPTRPPLHAIRINRVKIEDDLPVAPILPARPTGSSFELPGLDVLDEIEPVIDDAQDDQIREQAQLMEKTFAQFSMNVKVVQVDMGPVVTQYEIELEPGLRARKVIALQDDLAIALRAPSVRIIAPIPGRNTVGVEVPNQKRATVTIREVMVKAMVQATSLRLPIYIGKDVKGLPLVCDLAQMPHLLIAGRTGTGKSVCLNSLILSILLSRTPDQVRLLMIDPKMVELSQYGRVPHLLHPVVTDMRKAEALLGWAVDKMEERYALLARVGVRHIDGFNKLTHEERMERVGEDLEELKEKMPYIIVVADEMADLILTAKEVETHIIRLAQKSRAVGIHLVLATQKPTVDVITGLIKSNLPARIAFQVASRVDSMVVLDERGAEKLLGYGDMLFSSPGAGGLIRAQGTYVSDEEVTRVTEFLAEQGEPQFAEELLNLKSSSDEDGPKVDPSERDDLYLDAVEVVVREQRGSVSLLQRALGVGYGRAARLIDYMAEDGIVGPYSGSQAREVNYTAEQWDELKRQRFASV